LVGSVANESGTVTRTLFRYQSGTHELLSSSEGTVNWGVPIEIPFIARDSTDRVRNPIKPALEQLVAFFQSWRGNALK
jgi:hypothetical protein